MHPVDDPPTRPVNAAGTARAVALIRNHVLDRRSMGSDFAERGFFAGVDECQQVLFDECGGRSGVGAAYGGRWPYLEIGNEILAPGLPCAVTEGECLAPDGAYQRAGDRIERESAGRFTTLLALDSAVSEAPHDFDLLWFDEAERWVLRGGILEVSGLFAEFSMPASGGRLQQGVGSRRCDLDGLDVESGREIPTTVRVARAAALIGNDSWRDPQRFFDNRPELTEVSRLGSQIVGCGHDGERVAFDVETHETGWRAVMRQGRFLYPRVDIGIDGDLIGLEVLLDSNLDAGRPDVRARIAFDVNGDLVGFQKS